MSLIRNNRAAAVSSGTKQFDQESGMGISEDIKRWKREKEEGLKLWEIQAIEKQNAWKKEEEIKKPTRLAKLEAKRKMLTGLEDYLKKTKHITDFAEDVLGYPPDEYEMVDQRRKWILKKHEEWETRIWFEGDHSARDI